MDSEFQPGSRGRVLRNLLNITRVRDIEEAETQALNVAQRTALKIYGPDRRFTPTDVRRLHRLWLGSIYPWAGHYRTVNMTKSGFQFAHAPLIPRFMVQLGKGVLRRHTPCGCADVSVARSLAEVHAELILIHPFRDGNGRLARLVSLLMACQYGLGSFSLRRLAGAGKRTYVQAIHAAMSRDYEPLEMLFARAIELRHDTSST
ncbi:MAG TPA: Fic family protein [Steroidobacteraceae bacterium]|nr:Fic family protein [Steroidobacteraceae bacterium]